MAELSPREISAQCRSSVVRQFAHDLRDALSPIAAAVNMLRLKNLDPETRLAAAETIDRGLRRALGAIDAFVLAQAGQNEAEGHCANDAVHPGVSPDQAKKHDYTPTTEQVHRMGSATESGHTRILIVDDSAEVRKAYREPLVTLGYTVTEASDAEEALLRISHERPDVALIDLHLPGMNGYRLAQEMKARTGSAIRLIMLSAMTMDTPTRRASREAGFDDCLDKMAGPLELHRLLQAGSSAEAWGDGSHIAG